MKKIIIDFIDKYRKLIFGSLAFLLVVFVFAKINQHFELQKAEYESYVVTKNCEININGKNYFEGDAYYYDLSKLQRGDTINISFTLPETDIRNAIVYFENQNTEIRAYYDNKLVYTSKGKYSNEKKILGTVHIKIPVDNSYSGKRIDIEMIASSPSAMSEIPTMRLINARDVDMNLLADNVYSIFIGVFFGFLGIVSLLFMLFNFGLNNIKVVLMSLLCILASGWVLACFDVLELFTDNYVFLYYLEYETLFLAGNIVILYARECVNNAVRKKILLYTFFISFTYTVVATAVQSLKLAYFGEILSIYHLILIVGLVLIIFFFILEIKNMNVTDNLIIYGFFTLIVFAIVYAVLFFTDRRTSTYVLKYIPLALLVWAISNYWAFLMDVSRMYLSNAERKSLVSMAYKDPLTGINNRRACESAIKKVEKDCENEYYVISFDINNLKKINDTYGHTAGDEIIKIFANALSSIFNDNDEFTGRFGGDEFIVIMKNAEESIITHKIKKLDETIDLMKCGKNINYAISYSYGYEFYNSKDEGSFEDIMYMADAKMYKYKDEMKKERAGNYSMNTTDFRR